MMAWSSEPPLEELNLIPVAVVDIAPRWSKSAADPLRSVVPPPTIVVLPLSSTVNIGAAKALLMIWNWPLMERRY
jgi:hypothetical protein